MEKLDFLIVGAGIAGAGIAYRLAGHGDVMLADMEDQAGYHTTGRSAAFYAETYGGEILQPLTSASKDFLHNPPLGFTEAPLITPLGAIHLFDADQEVEARQIYERDRKSCRTSNYCLLTSCWRRHLCWRKTALLVASKTMNAAPSM